RDFHVTGVQTCALPIFPARPAVDPLRAAVAAFPPGAPRARDVPARGVGCGAGLLRDVVGVARRVELGAALPGPADPAQPAPAREIGRAACRGSAWSCVG